MKPIIAILSVTLFLLVGCKEKRYDMGTPPYNYNTIQVLFVDDDGSRLLDHFALLPDEGEPGTYPDLALYTLRLWVDGEELLSPDMGKSISYYLPIYAYPATGIIRFEFGAPKNLPPSRDENYVFRFEFSSLPLFGDNDIHTFVVEKKGSTIGYQNYAERIYFDGKLIASNVEGDSDSRIPIVVTVPTK